MTEETGVVYWKLTDLYEGDSLSISGLCGTDLDSNFHFLRGADIDSIVYNGTNTIEIKRVNGKSLIFKPTLNGNYQFTFVDGKVKIINRRDPLDYLMIDGVISESVFKPIIEDIYNKIEELSGSTATIEYVNEQIASLSATTHSEIVSTINSLDVEDVAEFNKVVVSVSETDGKINVTRGFVQVNCGTY